MATTSECRTVEPFIEAYVDGEFEPREAAELERHLAACPECGGKAKAQVGFKQALRRSAAATRAPAGLRDSIRARLADPDAFEDGPRARSRGGTAGIAIAAAVAGAVVWFAAGGLSRPLFGPRQLGHPLLEDGVALHARTLPLDYVGSDVAKVQRWLQGKLDFGVHLPVFDRGPALQGVRLSTVRARQAAAVSYQMPQAQARRVTLLIVDDPEERMPGTARRVADREVWLSHSRGYNVVSWRKGEIVYSLISDLDERDVLDLVRAASAR